MTVKLHRCNWTWLKLGGHACWRVQRALNNAGIDYEVVPGPLSRAKRTRVIEGTGQQLYPALEFEDGSWYHEQSKDMANRITEGRLDEIRRHQRAE
jgi:hypothetical protein